MPLSATSRLKRFQLAHLLAASKRIGRYAVWVQIGVQVIVLAIA